MTSVPTVSVMPLNGTPLPKTIENALIGGDLSQLSIEDRLNYYHRLCESIGLNPLSRPFEYILLQGKLTLYARKDCTDQLRNVHKVSVEIKSTARVGELYIVTARATKNDRYDESTGVVAIGKASGEALANALLKAETKAKRRVTLSICGLGFIDESEIETAGAVRVPQNYTREPAKIEPAAYAPYNTENQKMKDALGKFLEAKKVDPMFWDELSHSMNGRPYRLAEFEALYKEFKPLFEDRTTSTTEDVVKSTDG